MLMWLWAGYYRLVQAAAGELMVEMERESLCDMVEREREHIPPLE
jgi:hypothetical protein